MWTQLSNCLVCLLEEFRSYEILKGTTFDPELAYLVFSRSLKVDWERMCPAMEDPFVHHDWTTEEAFGLPDQRVHVQKLDTSSKMVYDERRLASVAIKCKKGIRCFILDDAVPWAHVVSGRDSCVVL